MAAEGDFSSGWKAMVLVAVVSGILGLGVGVLSNREDPRVAELQQRIQQLERKQQEQQFLATMKGNKAAFDREYGE
jgi:hypothetical protein